MNEPDDYVVEFMDDEMTILGTVEVKNISLAVLLGNIHHEWIDVPEGTMNMNFTLKSQS